MVLAHAAEDGVDGRAGQAGLAGRAVDQVEDGVALGACLDFAVRVALPAEPFRRVLPLLPFGHRHDVLVKTARYTLPFLLDGQRPQVAQTVVMGHFGDVVARLEDAV